MDYSECLEYLKRLGNEVHGMKFGLETSRALMEALGRPDLRFPSVLIAGTNGKGSVARMLHSIGAQAGIRTGLYTSPHLVRIEERIQINGAMISPDDFARSFSRVVCAAEALSLAPTFFELITVTGIYYLADSEVELGILEVGMGGRLDSTNVVEPLFSIITAIGIDHQDVLGEGLKRIAREKAGIMRSGRRTLAAPQKPEAEASLRRAAEEKKARLGFLASDEIEILGEKEGAFSFRYSGREIALQVPGKRQVANASLAIRAAEELRLEGFTIPDRAIRQGLESVRLPAVLEVVRRHPPLILDGGHNEDAAEALARYLEAHTSPPRTLVFGIMRDKEIPRVLGLLKPLFQRIYLTRVDSDRAASLEELVALCPQGIPAPDRRSAFRAAIESDHTAVVAGSFYLAGEFLRFIEEQESLHSREGLEG